MPVCEVDLRAGRRLALRLARPRRRELDMDGEYREVSPPERIVFTEPWGGAVARDAQHRRLRRGRRRHDDHLHARLLRRSAARDAALETGMKERHDAELRSPRGATSAERPAAALSSARGARPPARSRGHVHDAVGRALGAVVRARASRARGRPRRRRACSRAAACTWRARHGGSASTPSPPGAPSGRGSTSPSMRSTVSSRSCQKHRCPAIAPTSGSGCGVAPGRVGARARRRPRAPTSSRSGPCTGTR